ncbi:MAG: SDR family NAD(P)-dependent oxidoreductase [Chloroflexota bacterium]
MISTTVRFIDDEILERLRLHGLTFARDAVVVVAAYILAEGVRFNGPIPSTDFNRFLVALPVVIFVHAAFVWMFGIHRRLWQYAGVRDIRAVVHASALSAAVLAAGDFAIRGPRPIPVAVVFMGSSLALLGLVAVRLWREMIHLPNRTEGDWERVLVIGAGQAGQLVVADLLANPAGRQQPVVLLDDDPHKFKMRVHGIPVVGTVDDVVEVVRTQRIDVLAIAIPSATIAEIDRILATGMNTNARIQILPSHAEVMAGKADMRLRDLNLDDLLDRDPGNILADPSVQSSVSERVVLVTGARGSIGFELCRQLLRLNPVCVLALDNNETGLFYLQRELKSEPNAALLKPILADITEASKLAQVFQRYRPDVVFHAAAYKHVPILEAYPEEAIYVNVVGTMNLCQLAEEHGCERFVFVSTDKAVQPVNVLGFSKRIGELIVRSHGKARTAFCSVRFGNVVGSRGSALPEFVRQIDSGGPVSITHPDVERYFMTISEAVSLVIRAGAEAHGGELFMLDMGTPIKISDLVTRIIRLRGLRVHKDVEITYTGLRPGEKLTEELVFADEHVFTTAFDRILRVQDDVSPSTAEIEQSIAILSDAASRDDPSLLHVLLSKVAAGEPLDPRNYVSSAG